MSTVTVYEVLYAVSDSHPQAHGGAAGDGSFVYRTRNKLVAHAFAQRHRHPYGGKCEVSAVAAPRHLAARWGV